MEESLDRSSPEILRLAQAINEWVWGRWLSSWGRKDIAWFQNRALRYEVSIRAERDWLENPLNQDAGGKLAHPFRMYDLETGRFNLGTLLAIAAEPCAFERIHGRVRLEQPPAVIAELIKQQRERNPTETSISTGQLFEKQLDYYYEGRAAYDLLIADVFRQIGEERIEKERRLLCLRSEQFESNLNLLRLCRLMSDQEREHLRGPIGYAMLLREMAESIRYVAESALGKELPEEDMSGGAGRQEDGKRLVCGELRMLDSLEARHHFVRWLGLDFGLRAVCYVEGDTEVGALRALLPQDGSVDVVNLRGQGETPTLRQMLGQHRVDRVFTAMLIDGDREDRVRESQLLAREGLLTLGFAICKPDFEYGIGATNADRMGALKKLWNRRAVDAPFPIDILELSQVETGKELEALTTKKGFPSIKSREWGELLAEVVCSHMALEMNHRIPFWDLVMRLLQARQPTYLYETTTNLMRVNVETGRIESR